MKSGFTGLDIRAPGLPADILDHEPEEPGCEVVPNRERTGAIST